MTNLLILLGLTETVRNQYRDRLQARFPELAIDIGRSSFQGRPPYRRRRCAAHLHADAHRARSWSRPTSLKWIQTLGTGVDNLIDQPTLRKDVIVTNVRGIHGAAGLGGRARGHAGAGARSARRGARPGRAAMAALAGAASAQQDGRYFRHRPHCRGAGAEMQGVRHARRRREFGAAARWPDSIACMGATSFCRSSASSTSSCC